MFNKRTRLYSQFNFKNLFHIFSSLFQKKENFLFNLKNYLHVKNLQLTSQGRVALFDIVKLIIGNTGKKIFFIAPFTLPEVIYAIKYAGGTVNFIDIDKNTGLINPEELEKRISKESAAVIITHLYSNKNDLKIFLKRFSGKIKIIEDAAINFGATLDNKFVGTLADYGFFSFNLVKNLNTLNGGAIFIKNNYEFTKYVQNLKKLKFPTTNTLNLILTVLIIKILSNNFFYQLFHYLLNFIYKYKITFILKKIYPVLFHKFKSDVPKSYKYDFNWKMNNLGVYNLNKVEEDLSERRNKAKIYQKHLSENIVHKFNLFDGENIFLEYPIILRDSTSLKMHEILFAHGYDVRHTWYIDNSLEEGKEQKFKETAYVSKKIFCLPTHKNMSEKDIITICSIINNHG